MMLDTPSPDNETSERVVHLREWGTDRIHQLPHPSSLLVGTSETGESTSPRKPTPKNKDVLLANVRLACEREVWWIHDLDGRCGLRQDGARRDAFVLVPGVEIGIGETILIAESRRLITLRAFCRRILGWQTDLSVIDHALRSIGAAANRRMPLVLLGDDDLVPVAYALHRRTLGHAVPFIVCDRRRKNGGASVRSPTNVESGVKALDAASGGTLCLRTRRLPYDLSALMERIHVADRSAQLVILDHGDRRLLLAGPTAISVPPLQSRRFELPRIIDEYAAEAIADMNAPPTCFTRVDLEWVLGHAAQTLAEIEKATQRIVALKVAPNSTRAASMLGMAPVSLSRWLGRRSPIATMHERRADQLFRDGSVGADDAVGVHS